MTVELIGPLLLSLVAGSFLGVLIERLPHGRPLLFARSSCDVCGRTLTPRDLVPLLSWTIARGRCRHCGSRLSWFYPAIELAAIGMTVWAATQTDGVFLWASCLLGWTLLALAIIDWRHLEVPDKLSLPLIPAGLALVLWFAPRAFLDHAIGAAIGFLFVICVGKAYRMLRDREGIGLGDAKLLAASGAWLSWQGLPTVILIAAVAGLAATLVIGIGGRTVTATTKVPFGTYLCFATWIVWLYGPLVWD